MVIEHLIVERLQILLYVRQLPKHMLVTNGIPGILVPCHKNKSPLVLLIPNRDLEVLAALPLIPQMDRGSEPQGWIV